MGNLSSFHILLFFDILREEIQETSIRGGEKRILDENAAALCKTIKLLLSLLRHSKGDAGPWRLPQRFADQGGRRCLL